MPDYSLGKIYKIQPKCEHDEGDIYIGSTAQKRLCDRWTNHVSKFKCEILDTTSRHLFSKYGVSNCEIVLLESVNASSKDELKAVEANYIKNTKCVNKQIPCRSRQEYDKEYREKNRERAKEYRENNKEYFKLYRQTHKEQIKLSEKLYREKNKEQIKTYNRNYRNSHKKELDKM